MKQFTVEINIHVGIHLDKVMGHLMTSLHLKTRPEEDLSQFVPADNT